MVGIKKKIARYRCQGIKLIHPTLLKITFRYQKTMASILEHFRNQKLRTKKSVNFNINFIK